MSNLDRLAYNRAGQLFMAANVSAKTVSLVSTTATGVLLYNPVGSNKTLYVVDYGFTWTTVPAGIQKIGLAYMAPNITAPTGLTAIGSGVVSGNGSGNAGNAVARAYDAATLPVAPVAMRWAFGAAWITGGSGEAPYGPFVDYVDGAIAVAAGGLVQIVGETTSPVGVGYISWIEI
jgi:hypothetical protein